MLMTMMTQEKDSSVEPRSDVEWTRKHRWQCEWQCYHYQWHTPATPSTQIPTPHIHDNDDDHDNNGNQDQALSPESRHSNGSALGLGTSPVVQVLASSY